MLLRLWACPRSFLLFYCQIWWTEGAAYFFKSSCDWRAYMLGVVPSWVSSFDELFDARMHQGSTLLTCHDTLPSKESFQAMAQMHSERLREEVDVRTEKAASKSDEAQCQPQRRGAAEDASEQSFFRARPRECTFAHATAIGDSAA
eukprot:6185900-Pleurochrysis_carterae.AAC.1